jgi:2-oxoglutarate dehydrogenase E1 component
MTINWELFGQNSGFAEELYSLYQIDPSLVPGEWRVYFEKINGTAPCAARVEPTQPAVVSEQRHEAQVISATGHSTANGELYIKAAGLVNAYRSLGHLAAKINPLSRGVNNFTLPTELSFDHHEISDAEQSEKIVFPPFAASSIVELRDELNRMYCGSVGFEIDHIRNFEERNFLRERIESLPRGSFPEAKRRQILTDMLEAETFESELHRKYVGHKRFSGEGAEAMVPMLNMLFSRSAELGVKEAHIGMAHRGRLNVLTNVLKKPLEDILSEFEDQSVTTVLGSGDVKYHLGFDGSINTFTGNTVKVSLVPNPSHLEIVNPVLEGIVRARQDLFYRENPSAVLPVLIHGDAAFAGQGVVFETINMAYLKGYSTQGTIHLVVNNQIGFTTNPDDSRSSFYCTDMAKAIEAPVFHVNAEDPEAAIWIMEMAADYRAQFKRDVIIDLYCYRKYGHNEGDDPSFTQPVVYSEIKAKTSAPKLYAEKLQRDGVISADDVAKEVKRYIDHFEAAQARQKAKKYGDACAVYGRLRVPNPDTAVPFEQLKKVADVLCEVPEGFVPHPKLIKILEKRTATLENRDGIEWGFAEALAFGSLMLDGHCIRLSGQDCGRGTFSQRHLALSHYEENRRLYPLNTLVSRYGDKTGKFEVHNSSLSEAAVMGFDFGYTTVAKEHLVMWEAQFGDFSNGAQIVIDQFLSSSEQKWSQLSGLVLLLPHGYEGQGPEHSSARLERYLQLCGDGNMVVCYPSNAAQYFHMLRRHGLTEIKRPMVVMTPKSLLRLPAAAAQADDLTTGQFQTVIEETISKSGKVENLVFLSGKVYYDVIDALRKAEGDPKTKVVRVEQLYPFPQFELKKAIKDINPKAALWVQEEPQNMGAWSYIEPYLRIKGELNVDFVGRPASGSTATGSGKRHQLEQRQIVEEVLIRVGAK